MFENTLIFLNHITYEGIQTGASLGDWIGNQKKAYKVLIADGDSGFNIKRREVRRSGICKYPKSFSKTLCLS